MVIWRGRRTVQSPQQSNPQEHGVMLQGSQPDLVQRLMPQLRLTQVGLVAAVLSLAACIVALASFPDLAASPVGSRWTVATTAAAAGLLMICTVQHLAWRRALAEWSGRSHYELGALRRTSWGAHLFSYAVVIFGLWSGIAGSVTAGTSSGAAGLLAFALLFLLVAQALAGVNYLRTDGPPGTVPGHLRRLSDRINRLR